MSPATPGKTAKAASFLSALKSGAVGPSAAPMDAEAAGPLKRRIEDLERKLAEVAKSVGPPEDGEPPRPPSDLMLFLNTKMELLEKKLESAQGEALRANLILREREEAQRKAQKEIEELFHGIREQQRAASFDGALREEFSKSQARIKELEARLATAEARMLPDEEVLRALHSEEARAELERRIARRITNLSGTYREAVREQAPLPPAEAPKPSFLSGLMSAFAPSGPEAQTSPVPEPAPAAGPELPVLPPSPFHQGGEETPAAAPSPFAGLMPAPAPAAPETSEPMVPPPFSPAESLSPAPPSAPVPPTAPPGQVTDLGTAALLLGKIADLERRLEETTKDRDADKARRAMWEKDVLQTVVRHQDQWNRGRSDVVIEAALETLTLSIKERDEVSAELQAAVDMARNEPPGSFEEPVLRTRIHAAQTRLLELQDTIAKQLALVQAWIEKSK